MVMTAVTATGFVAYGIGDEMARREKPAPWIEAGALIRHAREKDPTLTQQNMASRVGISPGYYGHIEQGHARPKPEILRRVAGIVGVDYNTLTALYGYRLYDPSETEVVRVRPSIVSRINQIARLPDAQIDKLWDAATLFFHPGLGEDSDDTNDDDA